MMAKYPNFINKQRVKAQKRNQHRFSYHQIRNEINQPGLIAEQARLIK
jgi:hypothetical protein